MKQSKELFLENLIQCTTIISLDKEDVQFAMDAQSLFMEIATGVGETRLADALMSMKDKLADKVLKQGTFAIVTDRKTLLNLSEMSDIHWLIKMFPNETSLAWGLGYDDTLPDHSCKVMMVAIINN